MALVIWNRPEAKSRDEKATIALTDEQVSARKNFGESLAATLSKEGVLESLGAFVTPSNQGSSKLVALTVDVPSLTFTDPDGYLGRTRNFSLNINAIIRDAAETANASGKTVVQTTAMSYSELTATIRANRKHK